MTHSSEKTLLFYFLQGNNYNQSLAKLEIDIGYDLGDYSFKNKNTYDKAKNLTRQIWIELNGHFDEEGN